MRAVIVTLVAILFLAAPIYLVPGFIPGDSGRQLMTEAARDIVSWMPALPEVRSIAVAPLKGDFRRELQFALLDEFRSSGRFRVMQEDIFPTERASIRKLGREFHGVEESAAEEKPFPDAILTGSIQQNETRGSEHWLRFDALLADRRSGEVLWSKVWTGKAPLSGADWDLKKTLLLVCLASAAAVLVLFVRAQDKGGPE